MAIFSSACYNEFWMAHPGGIELSMRKMRNELDEPKGCDHTNTDEQNVTIQKF